MEIWKAKVTFADSVGQCRVVYVDRSFEDDTPMVDISDRLYEVAAEKLPDQGEDWDMIEIIEEQIL